MVLSTEKYECLVHCGFSEELLAFSAEGLIQLLQCTPALRVLFCVVRARNWHDVMATSLNIRTIIKNQFHFNLTFAELLLTLYNNYYITVHLDVQIATHASHNLKIPGTTILITLRRSLVS